jgi:hypothetical protein
MQSIWTRVAVLAALAAAVALFVVLSGGDDEDSSTETQTATAETQTGAQTAPEPTVPVIQVRDGQPVGGLQRVAAEKGERVNFEVELDRPEEEVHVHGYELTMSAQRSPVRFSFAATLEGVFEVEVHREDGSDVQIAELRVSP